MGRLCREYVLWVIGPAMILLAGFLNFIKFSGYPYLRPELVLSAGGLTAAGVLFGLVGLLVGRPMRIFVFAGAWTLFLDVGFEFWNWHAYWLLLSFLVLLVLCVIVQEYLALISTVIVSTIIASVMLFSVDGKEEPQHVRQVRSPAPTVSLDLPPVLHIILDGHIGIAGLTSPSAEAELLKARLIRFFEDNGFLLFERAYSHFFNSQQSIPHTLNFSDDPLKDFFAGGFHSGATLDRNMYFDRMIERGYQIHVIQTDYIDFCRSPGIPVASCHTVDGTGPRSLEDIDIAASQKARVILSQFVELSLTYQKLRYLYQKRIKPMMLKWNITFLPDWNWERKFVFPIVAPKTFLRIAESMTAGADGQLFFAHLGIPHEPFVFRSDCRIHENVGEWLDRVDADTKRSREARQDRNRRNFDQISCTYKLLAELFDALKAKDVFDRAIIVIHGDHGSRIMGSSPTMKNRNQLSNEDLVAGYSTLFAVKSPRWGVGRDQRVLPINWLLERVLFAPSQQASPPAPFIYLMGAGGGLETVPFDALGALP